MVVLRRAARRTQLILHYMRWSWRFERFGWGSTLGRPHKPGGLGRVSIGRDVELGPFWRLEAISEFHGRRHNGRIEIGDGVAAEIGLHIAAAGEVVIGPEVLIAAWVFISDHSHGLGRELPPRRAPLEDPRPVRIGAGSWLGERCVILPGVELGERCVVGAASVVTRSFPARSIIAGVPARLVRRLD